MDTHKEEEWMPLQELARQCEMDAEAILYYSEQQTIELEQSSSGYRIQAQTLLRLRKISRLRRQSDISTETAGLILQLMDRLERAEQELRELREQI